MDSFDPTDLLKGNSNHSIRTMDTEDVTNQSSVSSDLGASLDLDRHGGLARTNHLRTILRGNNYRVGDSQDGLGESFMLEDSFALGESFCCFEDSGGTPESPRKSMRDRPDISSILVIEEDEEDTTQELEGKDEHDESIMYELDQQARNLSLKPQISNISAAQVV